LPIEALAVHPRFGDGLPASTLSLAVDPLLPETVVTSFGHIFRTTNAGTLQRGLLAFTKRGTAECN
jgi:hypothetical protein